MSTEIVCIFVLTTSITSLHIITVGMYSSSQACKHLSTFKKHNQTPKKNIPS